jgi:hypothetical protein
MLQPELILNPKLHLSSLYTHLSIPDPDHSIPELPLHFFPLQHFGHLPQKIKLDKSNCIFDLDPLITIFTCNLISQEGASKDFISFITLHPPAAKTGS